MNKPMKPNEFWAYRGVPFRIVEVSPTLIRCCSQAGYAISFLSSGFDDKEWAQMPESIEQITLRYGARSFAQQ